MAKRIGKTVGFIGMVESGHRGVSDGTIQRICDAFDVDEAWLREPDLQASETSKDQQESADDGIALRLKAIRRQADFTQREFADKVGAHKNYIGYIERGLSNPSNDFLEKVAMTMDVNAEWLKTGEGQQEAKYEVDDSLLLWLNSHPDVVQELRERSGIMPPQFQPV